MSETRYHPYGEERFGGGSPTDFGFTSQRNERGFGLYDYNARYYSPVLGRFISPDTIVPDPSSSGGFNRYRYVRNNPLKYTDPSGHQECDEEAEDCNGEPPLPPPDDDNEESIDAITVIDQLATGGEIISKLGEEYYGLIADNFIQNWRSGNVVSFVPDHPIIMDAINNSDKLGRVARNLGLLGNALGIGTAGFNLGNEYFNPSSSNNLVQGAMLTQSAGELWYTGMNTAYSVTPLAPSVMIVDVADIAGTWVGAPDFAETAGNTIAIGTLSVLPETQQTVFNAIGHEMRTGDSPLSWSVRRLDATRANATGRSFLR